MSNPTPAPAEALIDAFEHEATRMARMVNGAQFSPHLAPVPSDFARYDAARTALRAALARAEAAEAERARLLTELEKLTVYAQDAERARLQQAEAHMRTHMRASMYDGTAAQVHQFYAARLAEITGNNGHLTTQEAHND